MSPSETIDSSFSINWRHQVIFTRGVFHPENPILADTIHSHPSANNPTRLMLVVDGGLAVDRPEILEEACQYFGQHEPQLHLAGPPLVVTGGETAKNDPAILHSLYQEIHQRRIDRHSWVLALGGGALLDVAGFATATAHRGCRHLRLPTTTLAQGDSGVGVKNGINLFGKKNFVGAFAPPAAVINDFDFLQTLPKQHLCSGCVEGLKVALIRDARFFSWIEKHAGDLGRGQLDLIETLIHRCAELHVQHITTGGDPFESGSARPLDFGHWSAHKLEAASNYQLSHGDAVAIGIALDTLYARNIGLLNADVCERILHVLAKLGFCLDSPELTRRNSSGELILLDGLDEFREHLGGQLTITLLQGIGSSTDVHEYQRDELEPCIRELHERHLRRPNTNS